jgi:hypothetical protein
VNKSGVSLSMISRSVRLLHPSIQVTDVFIKKAGLLAHSKLVRFLCADLRGNDETPERCHVPVFSIYTGHFQTIFVRLFHPFYPIYANGDSRISILDSYCAATYLTETAIAIQDAPVRYLSTSTALKAPLYETPNLLTGIAAALLALSSISSLATTAIVLPTRLSYPAPPKSLQDSDFSHLSEDDYEWPNSTMQDVHSLLGVGEHAWTVGQSKLPAAKRKTYSDIGEGGMYI